MSSGRVPRGGGGSCGSSIFSFLRMLHTDSIAGAPVYTSLTLYQASFSEASAACDVIVFRDFSHFDGSEKKT